MDLPAVEHGEHLGGDGRVAQEQKHQHGLDEVALQLGQLRVGEVRAVAVLRRRNPVEYNAMPPSD